MLRVARLAAIAGAALLTGCAAANLSPEQAKFLGDDQLCAQMATWRNWQGTVYEPIFGRFPVQSYETLIARHADWKAKATWRLAWPPEIGSSSAEVRCLFGWPLHINSTDLGSSYHTQWVYGGYWRGSFLGFAPATYLYFDDGVLTAVQRS